MNDSRKFSLLPNSLIYLELGRCFDQPLIDQLVPNSLRHLVIRNKKYKYPLKRRLKNIKKIIIRPRTNYSVSISEYKVNH